MYELRKAKSNDINLLIKFKLDTIYAYAYNITPIEKEEVENYVNNEVPKDIDKYKMIISNNEIIGCILMKEDIDNYILDEIYIIDEYRGKGIGSDIIIKEISNKDKPIILWVYKENKSAIKLYKNIGFEIIEETKTRYKMKKEQ